MKDINGNLLQQPYYDLAVMRREKNPNDKAVYGFSWWITPEGYDWWHEVYSFKYPPIPDTSLAELEAWMKEKQPAYTTDWQAKYEELLDKLEFYKKAFEGLKQTVEQNTPAVELTAELSNFIAECAMRAFAAYQSNPNAVSDVDRQIQMFWDCAEAMAAEGKKRGHLPNTENEKA